MTSADKLVQELITLVRLNSIHKLYKAIGAGIREAAIAIWLAPFYILVQFSCHLGKNFKPRAFHTS